MCVWVRVVIFRCNRANVPNNLLNINSPYTGNQLKHYWRRTNNIYRSCMRGILDVGVSQLIGVAHRWKTKHREPHAGTGSTLQDYELTLSLVRSSGIGTYCSVSFYLYVTICTSLTNKIGESTLWVRYYKKNIRIYI